MEMCRDQGCNLGVFRVHFFKRIFLFFFYLELDGRSHGGFSRRFWIREDFWRFFSGVKRG